MPDPHISEWFYYESAYILRNVDETYEWWGLRVKAMRRSLSLTQSELATKTGIDGVTQETISRIERGERSPGLPLALALGRVLGTPVEVLFTQPTTKQTEAVAA